MPVPVTLLVYLIVVSYYTVRASAAVFASAVLAQHVLPRAVVSSSDSTGRTVFTTFSLLAIFLIGITMGSRVRQLTRKPPGHLTVIQVLILLLYALSFAFVFSAAILESGVDLSTLPACRAAIYCCVAFYFLSKGVIQIFLAERAHAVRARHPSRLSDPLWITCMVFILGGFGAIMTAAFIVPVAQIGDDNICRIGLPIGITIPMISYDILVNAALTGIFIWLLQPLAKRRIASDAAGHRAEMKMPRTPLQTMKPYRPRISSIGSSPAPSQDQLDSSSITAIRNPGPPHRTWVDKLVAKSLIASFLVLLPTLANLGLLTHLKGHEQGWQCLTFCTLDGRIPDTETFCD
ncbi:hypothetical protein MBLNU457_1720t1 [Dothideomycetes sp. NU457]